KVEGIGEDFIPKTFDRQVIDEMVRVSDKESFNTARRLAREEGILAGGSSGTALAAALKYARRLDAGKTIVVILPDTGRNYIGKVFSDRWIQENGFWEGERPVPRFLGEVSAAKAGAPPIVAVGPEDSLDQALEKMHAYGISQLPVLEGHRSVGSLQESTLLKLVHDGLDFADQSVKSVMGKPLPTLDVDTEVTEAYRLMLAGHNAVIATAGDIHRSVVTRIDLIDFLSRRAS
ncbi:MAG TPA: pyridoxal-phosphate dependent enzyme, partial [Holophaga sp.]|nr:pyridoxal-phosphate dependent enzyme [Holophaga sp.]